MKAFAKMKNFHSELKDLVTIIQFSSIMPFKVRKTPKTIAISKWKWPYSVISSCP